VRLAIVPALILLAVEALSPAAASTFRAVSFDQKVNDADAIIMVRCIHTAARRNAGQRWIVTDATFAVSRTFKGHPDPQVTLVVPDGTVDGVRQSTAGVPVFRKGKEYVIFVRNTAEGPSALYFSQGVYDVVRNHAGGVVVPTESGAVLIDVQSGRTVLPEQAQTVEDFGRAVAQAFAREGERRTNFGVVATSARPRGFLAFVLDNKLLVALAVIGFALAMWQLFRR
jgi:hypothetical protein